MSAKPVWGWQPRRSLGSCESEGERQPEMRVKETGKSQEKVRICQKVGKEKRIFVRRNVKKNKCFKGQVKKLEPHWETDRKRWRKEEYNTARDEFNFFNWGHNNIMCRSWQEPTLFKIDPDLSDPFLPCWGIPWERWRLWLTTSGGFWSVFPILLQEVRKRGRRWVHKKKRGWDGWSPVAKMTLDCSVTVQ